jgi:hypothetical protein
MKPRMLATAVFTAALVTAGQALAASPAEQGYGGRGGVQAEVGGSAGGGLPFTGVDLAFLVLGGVLLVLLGIGLRRAVRRGS